MAVIWRKLHQGNLYEVRSAGRSRRLYVNHLLNTQYHPEQVFSGSLWDLLTLPVLLARQPPERVLVLGVGGGAVIHQLDHLLHPDVIVGVELNPIHIDIAERFFDLRLPQLSIHQAEAVDWIRRYQGPPFDLIVDDLFGEHKGEPCRAVAADRAWFENLLPHLSRQGMMVFNHIGADELRRSAALSVPQVRRNFGSGIQLSWPLFENRVCALYRQKIAGSVNRQAILSRFRQTGAKGAANLRFGVRALF